MIAGELSVLNVGEGDIRVNFNSADPLEVERARRIIADMLRRGYVLFVDEGDGQLKRAVDFDPATDTYIVADLADSQAAPPPPTPTKESQSNNVTEDKTPPGKETTGKKKPRKKTTRKPVKASDSTAVGVAPTAGG